MPIPFRKPSQLRTVKLNDIPVGADLRDCVTDEFTARRVQRSNFGDTSKIIVPLVETGIDATGRLEIHCRSGLIPALRGCLLMHGVRTLESCTAPKPHTVSVGLSSRNPQVVDFVTAVDRGRVLVHRRDCGLADAVAEIISGLPQCKIVVVVDDNAPQFCAMLRPLVDRKVDLSTSQILDPEGSNVVVSTWKSLGGTGLRVADLVVVVDPLMTNKDDPMFSSYPEPEDVAGYCPKLARLGDVTGKLIAVLDDEAKSPFESVRLSQVFGCQSVRILSHNSDPAKLVYPRQVSLLWARAKCANALGSANDPFAVKSAAAWKNRSHNRSVAKLAQCLAAGDLGTVGGYLQPVPAEWVAGKPLRVVVLVESLDHAESLSKKLPGWVLNTAPNEPLRLGIGQIATEMGAAGLDGNAIDVVLRADLGVGMANALLAWTKSPSASSPPLYVVDFAARGGALLRKWLRSRGEAYLDANWPVYGVHPDIHAYWMFRRGVTRRGHR